MLQLKKYSLYKVPGLTCLVYVMVNFFGLHILNYNLKQVYGFMIIYTLFVKCFNTDEY